MQTITVLGSTGSIGQSTLNVVSKHRDLFSVYALVAGGNVEQMVSDARQFSPQHVVMKDAQSAQLVRDQLDSSVTVSYGVEAMCTVSEAETVDMVMAAIVGAAGLMPSLAAAKAGKKVLLANKEALVMTGQLFMDAVADSGAILLPIDSEHNAIFQCLPSDDQARPVKNGVRKVLLTGSGGPFRERELSTFSDITVAEAIAHPNWSMGPKISVDSATMMNKGLELIEACWLFDVSPSDVTIVLHKQSIVHSMVEYIDGSVLAQMGNPDMRTPIAYGMAWPDRIDSGVPSLNFFTTNRFDFQAPDALRYPSLALAARAFELGGTAPAIMNAANEIAVEMFLAGKLNFLDIVDVSQKTLDHFDIIPVTSIDDVLKVDQEARSCAKQIINQRMN